MSLSISAAITQLTAGLEPGWTYAFYYGHCVLMVHTKTAEAEHPVYDSEGNLTGKRFGLPDGHSGFELTVISPQGEVIGEHTNLLAAMEMARVSAERAARNETPEKPGPVADAAPAVPAPPPAVPAAGPVSNSDTTQEK